MGAVIVETAIVLPVLFMVVAAVIDFGIALNNSQSVRQGAMDGARQIAVGNIGSSTCTPVSMGAGWASATNAACLVKTRTNLSDSSSVRVAFAFQVSGSCISGGTASASAPCSRKGDPVAVCVQYPITSVSGMWTMFTRNKQVRTEIVERLEKDPASAPTTGLVSETAPAGGDWSWCANPLP